MALTLKNICKVGNMRKWAYLAFYKKKNVAIEKFISENIPPTEANISLLAIT